MSSPIASFMAPGGTFPVSFVCALGGGGANGDSVYEIEGSLWSCIGEWFRSDSMGCVSVSMAREYGERLLVGE